MTQTPDVSRYVFGQDEAPFLDSGIKAKLVASALVQTGKGTDAINFLYQVSDGQKAVCAKVRDPNNKIDVSGRYVITQQNVDQEKQVMFTLNLAVHTLGFNPELDFSAFNGSPESNGMINEVMLSTKVDTYEGKSRIVVANVSKVDLTLTTERVSGLQSKFGGLLKAAKQGPFKFEKKTGGSAGGNTSTGSTTQPTGGPPMRDASGVVGSSETAEDDIPF